MRTIAVFLVASAALLAGCSKSPSNRQPQAAAAPASPIMPFQRPHPKPGLWHMAMTTDSGPGLSVAGDVCIDQNTENSAFEANPRARGRNCDQPKFAGDPGGGVAIDEVCRINQHTLTSHAVATGDFNNSYAVDVTSRMDPPLPGMGGGHTRIEARWLGPCKEGQAPGQMTGVRLTGFGRG